MDLEKTQDVPDNLLHQYIDKDTMKALMALCLRYDIDNNNVKADICKGILGSEFTEIGTGTNRIALRHNGLVVKIALDRRGLVDNFAEFKRSIELPAMITKVYESNYLVNICEYIIVMDQDTFNDNIPAMREVLMVLAESYLFADIGLIQKNAYNWGLRESRLTQDEIDLYGEDEEVYDVVVLDFGYMYPLNGQKEKLYKCPKCGREIGWDKSFVQLVCHGAGCNFSVSPMDLRRNMDMTLEHMEDAEINALANTQMPDLVNIEGVIKNIGDDYI